MLDNTGFVILLFERVAHSFGRSHGAQIDYGIMVDDGGDSADDNTKYNMYACLIRVCRNTSERQQQ